MTTLLFDNYLNRCSWCVPVGSTDSKGGPHTLLLTISQRWFNALISIMKLMMVVCRRRCAPCLRVILYVYNALWFMTTQKDRCNDDHDRYKEPVQLWSWLMTTEKGTGALEKGGSPCPLGDESRGGDSTKKRRLTGDVEQWKGKMLC